MKRNSKLIILLVLVLSFQDLRSGTPNDFSPTKNIEVFEQTELEIKWSSHRKLKWKDFKGKPDPVNYPNTYALTNSSIHFKGNTLRPFENGTLSITAVFNPFGSWVLSGKESDFLLKHEQLHFDITEVYARKIRKVLKEVKLKPYKREEDVWDMLLKIKYEYEYRQKVYDSLTEHGKNKVAQTEWESIVNSELSNSDLYKQE